MARRSNNHNAHKVINIANIAKKQCDFASTQRDFEKKLQQCDFDDCDFMGNRKYLAVS